jgi:hypothetical protein
VVLPFEPIREISKALPSFQLCGSFEPFGSPKPRGSASSQRKPCQPGKFFVVNSLRDSPDNLGRQKGLVDHVCPATFSYFAADRNIPLTILT